MEDVRVTAMGLARDAVRVEAVMPLPTLGVEASGTSSVCSSHHLSTPLNAWMVWSARLVWGLRSLDRHSSEEGPRAVRVFGDRCATGGALNFT